MILAGGSPVSGVSLSSLLLVLMSVVPGCWALEFSTVGDVARAGWSVRLDGGVQSALSSVLTGLLSGWVVKEVLKVASSAATVSFPCLASVSRGLASASNVRSSIL